MDAIRGSTLVLATLLCCSAGASTGAYTSGSPDRSASMVTTIDPPTGVRVRVTRKAAAGLLVEVADDCWDTYQREADSMTKELQSCLQSASWWNALEPQICGGIYVVEAEAALGEYFWCSARAIGSN
jgi:hypothetical protein